MLNVTNGQAVVIIVVCLVYGVISIAHADHCEQEGLPFPIHLIFILLILICGFVVFSRLG